MEGRAAFVNSGWFPRLKSESLILRPIAGQSLQKTWHRSVHIRIAVSAVEQVSEDTVVGSGIVCIRVGVLSELTLSVGDLTIDAEIA